MLDPEIDEPVRSTLIRALLRKLSSQGHDASALDHESKLLEVGLIDSEDLIEIILEVEEQCTCEFNPDEIDLENGLTLAGLTRCFVART